VKDQLAEVPVSDDQHTRLFLCDCQDILIGQYFGQFLNERG
jgi:hypothetical protein